MKTLLQRFIRTYKSPKVCLPLGIVLGLILGLILLVLSKQLDFPIIVLLVGAILSVVMERVFDFSKTVVEEYKSTHPLRKILGTIASEDPIIYISPFYRDINNPDESKLYRFERDRVILPLIEGTQYVYGRGDALALSIALTLIKRVSKKKVEIEDDWQALEKWGRSAICIGAHNAKTREILSKFHHTVLKFDMNYRVIVKDSYEVKGGDGETKFVPAVYQKKLGDSSVVDYGIILKLKDQFHLSGKPIIILAGIGEWGTAGAAYYLANNFEKLPFEKEIFGVLIQVPSGYESARQVSFEDWSDFIAL